MKTEGFASRVDARRELVAHDFTVGFSSPGRPKLWALTNAKTRDHRAIAHNGQDWQIVPYPEPATCSPEQALALQTRDAIFNDVDEEAEALEDLKRMGVVR